MNECPKCGSKEVSGLYEGFWVELDEDGEIVGDWGEYDGCSDVGPKRHCRGCGHEWSADGEEQPAKPKGREMIKWKIESSDKAKELTLELPKGVTLDEEGKHISQWILGEGSITPEPADSKNVIMSLKSYAKTRKTLPPEEEMSFSEMSSSVASAFRSVHPRSWVIEVYKGHLIVDVEESGFFSLGYKKEGGSFVFDDSPTWTKVEPKSTWIEAKSRREAEKSKTEPQEEVSATVDDPVSEETQPQPAKSKEATETEEVKSMDNEAGKSAITQEQLEAAIKSASEVAAKEAVKAFAEENKVVKAKVESEGAPNIAVIGTEIAKFDHVSIPDMAYMIQIMGKCHKKDPDASAAPSNNLRRALALRLESSEGRDNLEARAHMKSIGMPTKANEVMQSDLASFGDEWVGTSYDANLWHRIRQDTPIIGRIPTVTIPGGAESITIPFTSASPTFYLVAGAADQAANPGRTDDTVTTSKLTTGQRVLSTKKVGAGVNWQGELQEDSFVNFVTELRTDLEQEMAEVIEHIVIDGDTATGATTNINDIAGTPGGTEAFLALDGLRKLALVTNTANAISGGTISSETFTDILELMGLAGRNANDQSQVVFIQDQPTSWVTRRLTDVKTRDVNTQATIENGRLTNIWGYDVVTSANMHRANTDSTYGLKANSAGKVDLDTAANNTTGAILAVRLDQWRIGYKRRPTFEVQRKPRSDTWEITVLFRIGMNYRDTEASAIGYNLTL